MKYFIRPISSVLLSISVGNRTAKTQSAGLRKNSGIQSGEGRYSRRRAMKQHIDQLKKKLPAMISRSSKPGRSWSSATTSRTKCGGAPIRTSAGR